MKVGDKVIYKPEMKGLSKGTIGVIDIIRETYCVIVYEQNLTSKKPLVYAHSARFDEIEIITHGKR